MCTTSQHAAALGTSSTSSDPTGSLLSQALRPGGLPSPSGLLGKGVGSHWAVVRQLENPPCAGPAQIMCPWCPCCRLYFLTDSSACPVHLLGLSTCCTLIANAPTSSLSNGVFEEPRRFTSCWRWTSFSSFGFSKSTSCECVRVAFTIRLHPMVSASRFLSSFTFGLSERTAGCRSERHLGMSLPLWVQSVAEVQYRWMVDKV